MPANGRRDLIRRLKVNATRFSLLVQLSFNYRLLFFDAEYHDDPGAENADASQAEDTSSLENYLRVTDQQAHLQDLQQSETLLELSMDTLPVQPTAVATTLTTDQKCIYRILYISKIQQDATVCMYLFTAKSLYMFWVSIAPIIRST